VFELLRQDLQNFEGRLKEELVSSVAFIEAIGQELAAAGGKRLRPSLSFLAGRLLGVDPELTMRVALAVELLHSASLLHDDLIDDAETRRGSEAAFRRYGNVVSVMSGDYLLARVLALLAATENAHFTELMSRTAAGICEGEVLQFQAAVLESYSFETYRRVIDGKTAVLVAAALEGVALVADAPSAEREALRTFGLRYGRAFQMQDDYLDLLGDENTLGKPVGGDLCEGKATYPVLILLEKGVEEAGGIVRRHAREPGDIERMIELVRLHGADSATKQMVELEARGAIEALALFPDTPAKDCLRLLAERELERFQ
jgi:octaprenyl-diphosphate synthase